MDDLTRRLEELAARGAPRGADAVLEAAQARAAHPRPSRRPLALVAAAVAAVALGGGMALALTGGGGGGPRKTGPQAAGPRPTRQPAGEVANTTSTTAPAPPATSPSTSWPAPGRTPLPPRVLAAVRLQPFGSCTALLDQAKAKALEVVGPYGLAGRAMDLVVGGPQPASPAAGQGPTPLGAAQDFSTTNVQEPGVDEPDQVKTDGRRLFALSRGRLWAVDVTGPPKVLSSLSFESAREFLLVGDRVVVFANGGASPAPASGRPQENQPQEYRPEATATIIDVHDPATMRVASEYRVDGQYLAARLVDGVPRVVVRSDPMGLAFTSPDDNSAEAQARSTEHNRQVIRSSNLANWAPSFTLADGAGRVRAQGQAVSCPASYHPPGFSGFGMLSVVTLQVNDPASSRATSVMADGGTVYASTSHLYVATNQWGPVAGRQAEWTSESLVHEFDITDRTVARYVASGKVPGLVLNQFSFSDHGGHLRVATTDASGGSQSFVTVLREDGPGLVTVGQVGGLGKGERIYAVRFVGDTGYVVTFRQTDPLYVVDLSNPTRPRVVGQLDLLGYSAYLHPLGDGLLLGVGQSATEQGRRQGLQVSLFDVSNPAAPKRLQQYQLAQGQSSAEFDHHAFLWWPATKLAVLPVMQQSSDGSSFVGALGLHVETTGINEVGRVRHPPDRQQPPQPIDRSLVVGDRLYTVSQLGVLASDLGTLADRNWVPWS